MNNNIDLFNFYSSYLKQKYGSKVYRVAVDAGFSCPNRGDDRRNPGCSFYEESGSKAWYNNQVADIKGQIENGIDFLRKRYIPDHS